MKMRRILTALCMAFAAVLLCCFLQPTEVSAASESDLTFSLNDGGQSYSVTDCKESATGDLVIPSTYNGKPVTTIGDYAFYNCTSLQKVIYNGTNAKWQRIAIKSGNDPLTNATVLFLGDDVKLSGAAPTLSDNLAMNYKANKTKLDALGITNPYLVVTFNGVETTIRNYTVSADGTQYIFTFDNIAPNQMNDTLTAVLYATYGGNLCASAPRDYSIAEYCYNQLAKCTSNDYAKFRTLLVDLLNYGAASQQFTNYNTDKLVNANLTATQRSWGTATKRTYTNLQNAQYKTVSNPTVSWKGGGLVLQDSVTMRFKFATADTAGLTFKVESAGKTWTIDSFTTESGNNYIYFNGLHAGQMSQEVFITAYRNGTAVSNTVRYSIESYAYAKESDTATPYLADVVVAMMKYGDSAKAYIS